MKKKLVIGFGLVAILVGGLTWKYLLNKGPCVLHVLVPGNPSEFNGYLTTLLQLKRPKDFQCSIHVLFYETSDELLQKLNPKKSKEDSPLLYDLVVASGETASALVAAKFVSDLAVKKIPVYPQIFSHLRQLASVRVRNQVLGLPIDWTPLELVYNSGVIKTPPDSWNSFWLPKYRSRVALPDDSSSYFLIAEALGIVKPINSSLFFLDKKQMASIQTKLSELKIQAFTSSHAAQRRKELFDLFRENKILMTLSSPFNAELLRRAGVKVAETIPKEGSTIDVDFLMIPTMSKNKESSLSLINILLNPEVQKKWAEATGTSPVNPLTTYLMSPARRAAHRLSINPGDTEKYFSNFFFAQNPGGGVSVSRLWSDIHHPSK